MKNFDEFVGIVASDYQNLEERAVDVERKTMGDITTRTLRASAQETMEILRMYHEWANS